MIDAGLQAPSGLAYHESSRSLFVADPGLRQILHFRIRVTQCTGEGCAPVTGDGPAFKLEVEGSRHVVVDDVDSEWVAVDSEGNVYFSDQEEDTINRVDAEVLAEETEPGLSQDTLAHATTADIKALTHSGEDDFTDASGVTTLYHISTNGSDSKPTGISIVGDRVIWAIDGGDGTGSIEEGSLDGWDPDQDSGEAGTVVLVNGTAALAGVTATDQLVLFAGSGNHTSGVPRQGGVAKIVTESIKSPRAMVWDGDNTVFVADSEGNAILSVPCGALPSLALPAEFIAMVHQPFGLAIVRDQTLARAASTASPARPRSVPSWGPALTDAWESTISFLDAIFYALR